MDLKHDWKALNEILFLGQTPSIPTGANLDSTTSGSSTLVLVEENDHVIDGVCSNGKVFTDMGVGGVSSNKDKLDGLASKYGADQTVVLSKKILDQFVIEAASLGTNYFQQLQTLRQGVLGQIGKKQGLIVSRRHFILDLFGKKLKRLLPRRYNVLLFIESSTVGTPGFSYLSDAVNGRSPAASYRAILLSYSNGELDQFFEPDFSSLHQNRLSNWQQESQAIGQYLESRYILPCYGIFLHQDEWEKCLQSAKQKPWRMFVRYCDEGRAAVYPNSFLPKALLATQRVMVYFGRL